MTAAELIDRARTAGLKLSPADGGRLRIRGPKPLPADLVGELRKRKAEILEALEAEWNPAGVGPWQPSGNDRCCWCCGGGLQPDDGDEDSCGTCKWSMAHLQPEGVQ